MGNRAGRYDATPPFEMKALRAPNDEESWVLRPAPAKSDDVPDFVDEPTRPEITLAATPPARRG